MANYLVDLMKNNS